MIYSVILNNGSEYDLVDAFIKRIVLASIVVIPKEEVEFVDKIH